MTMNSLTKSLPGKVDVGQQRILHWLERYPFQRVQDLVVALRPWEGRGTVYRRVAALANQQLIESVHLGTSPKERLYYLSPPGQYACATWNADKGVSGQGRRLHFREEREKLIRLLPRLPIWLTVQNVVNGLVLYAARALARSGTGEVATALHWNWMREYHRSFVVSEQGMRVLSIRTDGALALCLRFSDRVEWHTFLFLYCPLDDRRLLKFRLDRLMRWRETIERSPSCNVIPPVLILATSSRQAEWWQLANAQAAAQLRRNGLLAAITTLPDDGHIENSWRLTWRMLGTDKPCHLQDLLSPATIPALAELLDAPGVAPTGEWRNISRQEAVRITNIPIYLGKRSYVLTAAAQNESGSTSRRDQALSQLDYRLISLLLVPREFKILSLLLAHPLLSRDDLSALLGMREKSVQILLAGLLQKGLLIRAETQIGGRWHLSEIGLRLLARRAACHVYRFVRLPVRLDAPLQQRGLAGLLHQIRHTAGVYGFFMNLITSLAASAGGRLGWWETGAMCEHTFIYREHTYHFKPDAFAAVQLGARQLRFWLEWDRGTMGVRDLERKCATYAAYLSSREWAIGDAVPPVLVYVAPEINQERRFIKVACALLAHISALHLYTTTASLVAMQGVLAPIFQQVVWPLPNLSSDTQDILAQRAGPLHYQRVALFAKESGRQENI